LLALAVIAHLARHSDSAGAAARTTAVNVAFETVLGAIATGGSAGRVYWEFSIGHIRHRRDILLHILREFAASVGAVIDLGLRVRDCIRRSISITSRPDVLHGATATGAVAFAVRLANLHALAAAATRAQSLDTWNTARRARDRSRIVAASQDSGESDDQHAQHTILG
jgi:hypothetical protein